MAAVNPPGFLQNAGSTHTAEQFRNWIGNLIYGRNGATSLVPRGGVNPSLGNALTVTQAGSPNMTVVVKSGLAAIPGSEGSKQGVYSVLNDADTTVTITAAHATLARIDSIVFKVQDTAYSGAVNTSSIVSVDGTPSGSPAPPTLPNNCLELARVAVAAATTSIVNGNITDKRVFLAAVGGTIICTAATRPSNPNEGMLIYQTDTDSVLAYDGTTWNLIWAKTDIGAWSNYTPSWTAASVNPAIGNGTITGRYIQIGKIVHFYAKLIMGSTSTYGTGQWYVSLPVQAAATTTFGPMASRIFDNGVANRSATAFIFTGELKVAIVQNSTDVTSTSQTWGAADELEISGTYEAL